MNAQSVHVGYEYAWAQNKRKGEFPMRAVRVRVLGKFSRVEWGNTRETTYAKVLKLDSDPPREAIAPIRDIVDFWDNYVNEKEAIERDGKERGAVVDANRANSERILKEIENWFKRTFYNPPEFTVTGGSKTYLTFDREELLNWLGISTDIPPSLLDNFPDHPSHRPRSF
jgi:hypothetical protein